LRALLDQRTHARAADSASGSGNNNSQSCSPIS
jgi:hypothetical protein